MVKITLAGDFVEASGSPEFESWAIDAFVELRRIVAEKVRCYQKQIEHETRLDEIQRVDWQIRELKSKLRKLQVQP